eukprot:scaffold16909_cov64-Phaeocystis_antarctica.AAC.1
MTCGATARPRLVRVRRTYSAWGPGSKLLRAFGTYSTQEAGTRSPYVQYGGSGASHAKLSKARRTFRCHCFTRFCRTGNRLTESAMPPRR